jgi:hypothetical protein
MPRRDNRDTFFERYTRGHVRRAAVVVALLVLAIAAVAGAQPQPASLTPRQPCATIKGQEWSQTINVTANSSPPKPARLRVFHGKGYYVFVDHLRCAWAGRIVSRLIAQPTLARLRDASPEGYVCRAGRSTWFRDPFNGDAVRRSEPPTSVGTCLREGPNALGLTYRTFWWSPAKPCRTVITATCRR